MVPAAGEQVRGEGVDDADGAEQVRGHRRLGCGGVRRVAQVFGEQHAGHRDDDDEVGVRAEDFVAGAQDGVGVRDVDADGVDAVLGLGLRPPAMKTVRLVISTLTSLWLWC
jgi:hypothetical protein